jgi:hypothetical protein
LLKTYYFTIFISFIFENGVMALLDLGVYPFISARYCFFQRVTADGPAPEIAIIFLLEYFLAAVITIKSKVSRSMIIPMP